MDDEYDIDVHEVLEDYQWLMAQKIIYGNE